MGFLLFLCVTGRRWVRCFFRGTLCEYFSLLADTKEITITFCFTLLWQCFMCLNFRERYHSVYCIMIFIDTGQMQSCCLTFHLQSPLGSERWFFFFFSQVVAACLQFLFFSAAQGLIRLIFQLALKADEDLDLTYINQRYVALQCVINYPISCAWIKCRVTYFKARFVWRHTVCVKVWETWGGLVFLFGLLKGIFRLSAELLDGADRAGWPCRLCSSWQLRLLRLVWHKRVLSRAFQHKISTCPIFRIRFGGRGFFLFVGRLLGTAF